MSMNIHSKNFNNQVEIANLITEAVKNASSRRNQVLDAEEPLSDLPGEDAKGITGGLAPLTCGGIGVVRPKYE